MGQRKTQTFSMSFLDVISCGFGAVVLFYTIISAQAGLYRIKESADLSAESRKLEQEVLDGYKHLAELRNALESTEDRTVRAAGLSREMLEKLKLTEEELARTRSSCEHFHGKPSWIELSVLSFCLHFQHVFI
jgi:hypothetical protein